MRPRSSLQRVKQWSSGCKRVRQGRWVRRTLEMGPPALTTRLDRRNPAPMRKGSLVAAVAAALLALAPTAEACPIGAGGPDRLAPYGGTGSWVSIYDTAAWRDPEGVIARLSAHHVHTLYLETANDRQRVDVVHPETVGRFLEAAHATGIDVVGWYLPSLT